MPSPLMMDPVERLLAYEEIRQLAARYAVAIDARDLDSLVALFVDDELPNREAGGSPVSSRDVIRRSFVSSLRSIGITILNVGTHVIDLAGPDHATGLVYCKAEIQDGDRWIHQAILYRDTYERRAGTWQFVQRVHELFYGAEVGMNPLGLPPANWPEHHDGMGTAPASFPTWSTFWSTP